MDKITKNCVYCNKEFSANVCDHDRGYAKYCGSECQHAYLGARSKERAKERELAYASAPSICTQCGSPLSYEKKNNKFCSRRCSYNANQTELVAAAHSQCASEKRRKSAKGFAIRFEATRTKPKYEKTPRKCTNCQGPISFDRRRSLTCSDTCKSEVLSNKSMANPNCGGSTKQYIDYKGVSLDSSWELKVALSLDEHGIRWDRPKYFRLKDGRRYTPDFYLPDFEIYLDPKAYRKGYLEQVQKIEIFEQDYDTRCLILNKNQLLWEEIMPLIATGWSAVDALTQYSTRQ